MKAAFTCPRCSETFYRNPRQMRNPLCARCQKGLRPTVVRQFFNEKRAKMFTQMATMKRRGVSDQVIAEKFGFDRTWVGRMVRRYGSPQ